MPENACAVPVCKWLCPSLLETLDLSNNFEGEATKAGWYFGADPLELVYSEFCFQTQDRSDSPLEPLQMRRTTVTVSLETVARMKKSD